MRITINEELAKRAKEAYSFSDYKTGSTTKEYLAECEEVESKINTINPKYQDQIIKLVDRFTTKYGEWINKKNSNDASYPSVMIAGPAKYNYKRRDKQNQRNDTLWNEYKDIQTLKDKIMNFKPKLDEDDEVTQLQKALEKDQKQLELMKNINAHYRKHNNFEAGFISEKIKKALIDAKERAYNPNNWTPFESFSLTNLRNRIKTKEANLAKLTAPKQESKEKEINDDIKIVENTELNRLQILFNDIPSVEVRNLLKSKGFRWSPTNKAWQRQLTPNALWDLKHYILPELA